MNIKSFFHAFPLRGRWPEGPDEVEKCREFAGYIPDVSVIPDSHKKQTKSTFYGSLHETSSALSVQKADASSSAFSIKSVCFLSKNRITLRIPLHTSSVSLRSTASPQGEALMPPD
ncbi:MAG: hypothetical protein MSA25_11690 [Clostridiales bacterium]|nr:hypothetical protein [Clostridiales bacterium]